ncbi:MAG: serine hydrolase [Patescibacteria group bacterium]|nr:serine hydrolase [Patescibacteria group bacterium]MCL5224197.1 serine hydrolase [Patescibacteria group bacterium]
MRLPKISKSRLSLAITGLAVLAIAAGLVISREQYIFSYPSNRLTTTSSEPTSAYSDTATALKSVSSIYQYTSSTDAATAAVYSLQDGTEILGWNDGKQWPIASLTKLMTALVTSRLLPSDQLVTVSSTDEQYLTAAQAAPTFKVGDTLTVRDLITSMMIVSSDDAAEALADYYGRDKFLQVMNDTAKSLNMDDTRFVSPSGLSPQNLSTTSDLFQLVKFIWSTDPNLLALTRQKQARVTVYEGGAATFRYLTNIDQFAGAANFLGGKTGTLPVSAQNIISIFESGGAAKVIIVLGSTNRYAEATKLLTTL